MVNESISKCLGKIKQSTHSIAELLQQIDHSIFGMANTLISLCEEVLSIKVEMQTIATQFKKKSQLSKGKQVASYETKSNNLAVLREETQTALHGLVGKIDSLH